MQERDRHRAAGPARYPLSLRQTFLAVHGRPLRARAPDAGPPGEPDVAPADADRASDPSDHS